MDRRTASIALALTPLATTLKARAQLARTARVAVVLVERENPGSPFLDAFRRGMREAGWVDGRNLVIEARWGGGVGATLDRAIADAMLAFADGVTIGLADRFAAKSRRDRIPAVSGWSSFAEKGNVMTCGPVLGESHARLAVFVDRILEGAKPSELPVEQPTVHEFVVNRRVAKELGIAIPAALLARADRMID